MEERTLNDIESKLKREGHWSNDCEDCKSGFTNDKKPQLEEKNKLQIYQLYANEDGESYWKHIGDINEGSSIIMGMGTYKFEMIKHG